ncbi:amidohydrolase family protein [Pelomyxa schiedti]|nr:amidohydrolase family protein [Pelomyxa schiedti]
MQHSSTRAGSNNQKTEKALLTLTFKPVKCTKRRDESLTPPPPLSPLPSNTQKQNRQHPDMAKNKTAPTPTPAARIDIFLASFDRFFKRVLQISYDTVMEICIAKDPLFVDINHNLPMAFTEEIHELLPHLLETRRAIHMHPEVATEEHETQKRVIQFLHDHIPDVSTKVCATTGVVVDIKGPVDPDSTPERMVALRADLDALPMTEGNEGMAWRSQIPGKAHMCGHDGHITMLLGAAVCISKVRSKLPPNTTVRFLFQPAEEGIGGAKRMIAEGALEGVDEIYAVHAWADLNNGLLAIMPGYIMSHMQEFYVTITGSGGHASAPHRCVDPLICACQTITSLQSIISRNVPPTHSALLSVTTMHGGEANNVIPNEAKFTGTIRTFDAEDSKLIYKRLEEIVMHTSEAYGASAKIELVDLYPSLFNTEGPVNRVRRAATRCSNPFTPTTEGFPFMASEDFAFYTQAGVPGAFCLLGSTHGNHGANHTVNFDFDDSLLNRGMVLPSLGSEKLYI